MSSHELPGDVHAERMLLATLAAPGAERLAASMLGSIRSTDFVHPAHRAVWEALRSLVEMDVEVNAITLRDAVEKAGVLGRVGGFQGLVDILGAEEVGRPEALASILRLHQQRRAAYGVGMNLARLAQDRTGDIYGAIADAGQELGRIVETTHGRGLEPVSKFTDEVFSRLLERVEGRQRAGVYFPGFDRWQALTRGLQPGQLMILAARTSVGKTALALNWTLAAAENGSGVAFFSLEMSGAEVLERLLVIKSGVQCLEGSTHALGPLAVAKAELEQTPLYICDRASITIPEIVAYVDAQVARRNNIGLVVVDYLQLVSTPQGKGRQTEAVRIGEISRSLKLLAMDRRVPVVVLSQLNREVEHRQGGRPILSDLRDSGCIEQDADLVAFLWRDVSPGSLNRSQTELIVAKHRNGPIAVIPMEFAQESMRFYEVDPSSFVERSAARRHSGQRL